MAQRTWQQPAAGQSADWFAASNWVTTPPDAPDYPQPGDDVAIADGEPTLSAADAAYGPLDDLQVTLGSDQRSTPAMISTAGVGFGANFTLTSTGTAGYAALHLLSAPVEFDDALFANAPGGRFQIGNIDPSARPGSGPPQTFTAGASARLQVSDGDALSLDLGSAGGQFIDDGVIGVTGASFEIQAGALLGTGQVTLQQGSSALLGAVTPTVTVGVLDPYETIELSSPAAFQGKVTGFQTGDLLELESVVADQVVADQVVADQVAYDAGTGTLTALDAGTPVATLNVASAGGSLQFHLRHGRSSLLLTTSEAVRVWQGGTGDWSTAANWTTITGDPSSAPLNGDTLRINKGTAEISATDASTLGPLNADRISLGSGQSTEPATLQAASVTFGPDTVIRSGGDARHAELQAVGTTVLDGTLNAVSRNGVFTLDIESDGTSANFINAPGRAQPGGVIVAGTESALHVTGGTLTNDNLILALGSLDIAQDAQLLGGSGNNPGEVQIGRGGTVSIEGTVGDDQAILFGASTGELTLANLSGFNGEVVQIQQGDKIDLTQTVADGSSYDPQSGELTLLDAGQKVGSLAIFAADGGTGFQVAADRTGGTLITYKPAVTMLQPSLPVPVVAAPGSTVSLADILTQAFGSVPTAYSQYGLSYFGADDLSQYDFSYWDPQQSSVSQWTVGGTPIAPLPASSPLPPTQPTQQVAAGQIGSVGYLAGNEIASLRYLTVPVAGPTQSPTETAAYDLVTIDPAVLSPTAYSGRPDPADIVASADRFAAYYPNPPNDNDCGWIGDAVAAAAGATMPSQNQSTDPDANVSGGFWRVVYRGSDQANPDPDWYKYVQSGDVVRMGWKQSGGQHTTTVVGSVNSDGSLPVYDNAAPEPGSDSDSDVFTIGLNNALYWPNTIPQSITIYRLDPLHQYLITGTPQAEVIQGSVYNNLIQPGGGADTITAGAGNNEIQAPPPISTASPSPTSTSATRSTSPISRRLGRRRATTRRPAP